MILFNQKIDLNLFYVNNNIHYMSTDIITFGNYKFELELLFRRIKIRLTDITSNEIYESIINEDDINDKPIKTFYSIIIKSLNKENNYNIQINDNDTIILCTISYSNEIVEYIIFTKEKNKLLLLRFFICIIPFICISLIIVSIILIIKYAL
jgi:hypothetical protein